MVCSGKSGSQKQKSRQCNLTALGDKRNEQAANQRGMKTLCRRVSGHLAPIGIRPVLQRQQQALG